MIPVKTKTAFPQKSPLRERAQDTTTMEMVQWRSIAETTMQRPISDAYSKWQGALFQEWEAHPERVFVNLGDMQPMNTVITFPTHCHCTKSCLEIIVRRCSRIQYYVILEVGGSAKREKATTTTTNGNNRRIIEINYRNEPTY